MNILGISAFYHDSAACLVQDGEIISAVQEERFTRKKHDFSFPRNALRYCLDASGLQAGDLDYVVFYDKPFIKFERILETYLAYAPNGVRSFIKAMPLWVKQKIWMKEVISRELDFEGTIIFPEHHIHCKRVLGISEGPQKVVVGTDYYFPLLVGCPDYFYGRVSGSPLYLYPVLTCFLSRCLLLQV